MSFAAYKMMHWPTGVNTCASGFITHSRADFVPQIPLSQTDELDSDWPSTRRLGPIPNLVITAANILEIYVVRVHEESAKDSKPPGPTKRSILMDGISGASLELVCQYRFGIDSFVFQHCSFLCLCMYGWNFILLIFFRLHGNVESMAVLAKGGGENSRKRDSIVLAFQDAKISVLEFDDSTHGLRTT